CSPCRNVAKSRMERMSRFSVTTPHPARSTIAFGHVGFAHENSGAYRLRSERRHACEKREQGWGFANAEVRVNIRGDCKIRFGGRAQRRRGRPGRSQASQTTPGLDREFRKRRSRGTCGEGKGRTV